MDDGKSSSCLLQEIIINPRHLEVIYSYELKFRKRRIYHWPEHIEKSSYSKVFPDRPYGFQCRMKHRCMKKSNIRMLDFILQSLFIIFKFKSELFHYIGSATDT